MEQSNRVGSTPVRPDQYAVAMKRLIAMLVPPSPAVAATVWSQNVSRDEAPSIIRAALSLPLLVDHLHHAKEFIRYNVRDSLVRHSGAKRHRQSPGRAEKESKCSQDSGFHNDPFAKANNCLVTPQMGDCSAQDHQQVKPPSTFTTAPVIKLDASLARKCTTEAISSGRPKRPIGVSRNQCFDMVSKSGTERTIGVSI